MVNGPLSAMELKDLSANWKKLQETMIQDAPRAPKRKAADSIVRPQHNGVKYQKTTHTNQASASKAKEVLSGSNIMGLSWSSVKKDAPSASLALWAEDNDIPAKDLATAYGTSLKSTSLPEVRVTAEAVNEGLSSVAEAGRYIAIDCEMVGVGPTPDTESALARVSIVNYHGHQLYDSFVLPKETITDYRTYVSGITPELLREARSLQTVQEDVAKLLDGRILIGHAIKNDLAALLLGHSKRDIRDTSRHPAFRALAGGKTPGLKKLARQILGVDIQGGEHSSIEDARATMLLFRRDKQGFESEHLKKWGADYKRSSKPPEGVVEHLGANKNGHRKKRKAKK